MKKISILTLRDIKIPLDLMLQTGIKMCKGVFMLG